MSGHSPGPWVVSCGSIAGMPRTLDDNSLVVITGRDAIAIFSGSEETREANANLVAAAPDLLAALREILEHSDCRSVAALRAARAAVKRTEGRPT